MIIITTHYTLEQESIATDFQIMCSIRMTMPDMGDSTTFPVQGAHLNLVLLVNHIN
uniref:Uncharacterized protein n=1 Tax=Arundo donax TaxID=35708 RepID=A0A0A9G6V3_ARUDO